MIKRIQLRGISRTPSDRMTADGGCAESLNVHLEENEIAPTLNPEDVTEELGLPLYESRQFIFIHKGNGYKNFVTVDGLELGAYLETGYETIAHFEDGETYKTCTSVGNTLVIMGSLHPYYALFKNGHYVFLGNKIPLPTIQLYPEPVESFRTQYSKQPWGAKEWSRRSYGSGTSYTTPDHCIDIGGSISMESWNKSAEKAEKEGTRYGGPYAGEETGPAISNWIDFLTLASEGIANINERAKEEKYFVNQMFVMYGIRLYNNAYITSVPVLMPGGFECPYSVRYFRETRGTMESFFQSSITYNEEKLSWWARYPYLVKAKLLDFDEDKIKLWEDIIMSIDFFITPIIPFDVASQKVAYVTKEYLKSSYSKVFDHTYFHQGLDRDVYNVNAQNYFEIRPCSEDYARHYIDRLLAMGSGDFRLAESVETDLAQFDATKRIAELREGTLLNLENFITGTGEGEDYTSGQDLLLTQPALAEFDYDMRNPERTAERANNINNRLLISGITETLPSGQQFFPAASCTLPFDADNRILPMIEESYRVYKYEPKTDERKKSDFSFPQDVKYVQIVYHIKGDKDYVVRGRIGEDGSFVEKTGKAQGFFGFLLFPDARCHSCDVLLSYDNQTWYRKTYEMKEHPALNCAYMYSGVDKNILWEVGNIYLTYNQNNAQPIYNDYRIQARTFNPGIIVENRLENKRNTLLLSDTDNPWYFPLGNSYQIQASMILGTALTTKALSEGQFGQFDLYVFTDNGIWAMKMTEEGTFASSHAVSMDVAIPGTILTLDQSVAFLTDRGLMSITGSNVQNLSPNMNGAHYVIEDDARAILANSPWAGLLEPVADAAHFMKFMKESQLAYDYIGERIICFNKSKDYMYVLMLKSMTWHKMTMPDNYKLYEILNSYPDAYVSASLADEGSAFKYGRILNFSTVLDVASKENLKGIIITRPFDLEEPDVRKALKTLRIKGQFNRTDVQYILLGSMDGINWGVLPSLRGGSYKLFRLVLLTNLSPTERISWIDIDYESRFANKLR